MRLGRLGLFLAARRRAATNSNRVTVSFGAAQSVTPTTYAPSVSISGGPVSITTGAPSGVTPTTYAFVVSPVQIETGSPANVTPTTYAPTVSVVTDDTAPVISAAWDEANNEIDLTITEDNYPVTVRWQIRAVATAAPDESAMLAGTGGILNGSYSASSTPDSEVIDVSSLTDATDYTLYVMVSDPAGNHSAISDDDFTYTDPTVTITTGTPSGVTPTTYAPTVSVSGGTVSITTDTPSSVTPTTYAPDVSVSGGGGVSRVATATGYLDSDTASQSVSIPGTLQEDDLVIFYACSDSPWSGSPFVTSGYTGIFEDWTGTGPAYGAAYKFMGASPDSTISVDGVTGRRAAYVVEVWRGIDTTTPLDGVTPSYTTDSDPASITTNTDGAVSIIAHFLDDDDMAGSGVAPSGWGGLVEADTEQASTSVGATTTVAYQIMGTAGVVDPGEITGIGTDGRRCRHFALRAA